MKPLIVCISSTSSLGNTFLDWSIQYLSGHSSYTHVDRCGDVIRKPLSNNPLISQAHDVGNAHGHKKTYTDGSEETKNTIIKLKSFLKKNEIACVYPSTLNNLRVSKEHFDKKITDEFFRDSNNLGQLLNIITNDYPRIFEVCNQEEVPLIYVEDNMWNCNYKPRGERTWDENGDSQKTTHFSEIIYSETNWKFLNSQENFDKNIWDIREHLALHLRPKDDLTYNIDFSLPHYFVEANSLWTDGEHVIKCIMAWLKLEIDKDRFSKWQLIYKQWQQMQLARLRLPQNIDFVCKAIINGWSHDLSQYNLDLFDEAYIQHMLIYKHRLTLKNWRLEKFPFNTKDLTPLLEESFYQDLEELY